MSRYLYTTEAAAVLRVSVARAWRILKDAGVEPLGRDGRDVVWRASEVVPVVRYRQRFTAAERLRRATILAGIARRRAKREAANA